jgi:tyrosyl-tRNA synthetase
MPDTNPEKIEAVLTRGVDQILPNKEKLAKLMSEKKIKLYLGIDPTAAYLHLGHSVPLRKLQDFAELGHEVILLVGNGTVKIGDPTGRDESRPVLTDEEIEKNFQNWKKQASKILDFDLIEIRHNGDWLDKLSYAEMVKLMARTTIQQLLERDMFQRRIEDGLPIHGHEIIYPLLQGYDSVVMDVDLEVGGTDQTFNMMMGRHLMQSYGKKEKWVLTTPLIEGTDGRKMSKSFNNYVALTDEPIDVYGKLMRVADELIIKYFELLTRIDMAEIKKMETAIKNGENPMIFKKKLAFQITKDLHNEEEAQKAEEHFATAYQKGEIPEEENMEILEIEIISDKQFKISAYSNGEIRRLIEQRAVKILPDMEKVENLEQFLELATASKIKIGRRFFKISKV